MNASFRQSTAAVLAATALLSLTSSLITPMGTVAQVKFNPPSKLKAPGNREGGLMRSDSCAATAGGSGLTVILPTTNLGLTTKAFPSFFAYVPPNNAEKVEFRLVEESSGKGIFTGQLQLPENSDPKGNYKHPSTVLNVALPSQAAAAALEPDKNYLWAVMVVCNAKNRAEDIVATGVVQRVGDSYLQTLDPAIRSQLSKVEAASPQEQLAIFGTAGIWNDMLVQALALGGGSSTGNSQWQSLLSDQGLKAISDAPVFKSTIEPLTP